MNETDQVRDQLTMDQHFAAATYRDRRRGFGERASRRSGLQQAQAVLEGAMPVAGHVRK